MKKIILISWICFSVCSSSEELVNGKALIDSFPRTDAEIDFGYLEAAGALTVKEVVKLSDNYLAKAYGADFKPTVRGVSVYARKVEGGRIWVWMITYHHPQNNDLNNRVFSLYFDSQGKPLTSIVEMAIKRESRASGDARAPGDEQSIDPE